MSNAVVCGVLEASKNISSINNKAPWSFAILETARIVELSISTPLGLCKLVITINFVRSLIFAFNDSISNANLFSNSLSHGITRAPNIFGTNNNGEYPGCSTSTSSPWFSIAKNTKKSIKNVFKDLGIVIANDDTKYLKEWVRKTDAFKDKNQAINIMIGLLYREAKDENRSFVPKHDIKSLVRTFRYALQYGTIKKIPKKLRATIPESRCEELDILLSQLCQKLPKVLKSNLLKSGRFNRTKLLNTNLRFSLLRVRLRSREADENV